MGFASYFLIVWDFVRYARETGIPASARGSACGALVSYLLQLSHVCPLKYDLLFERFLDPNRSEAPDIDIDLCQERRYEVIEYVRKKYGDANVAQIGTFGTLEAQGRASRTSGGRSNIPLARVEQINKLVPARLNITLDEAIKEEPALRRMADEDPEVARLLDFARRLEGHEPQRRHPRRRRGDRRPAAGRARPAAEDPQQRQGQGGRHHPVGDGRHREGRAAEDGLPRPAQSDHAARRRSGSSTSAIPRRRSTSTICRWTIAKTFELLQRGETKGVFQLESAGIRDLLIKMKPDRFADIIATNALYRPGPLNGGMVDEYVDVKNGRKQPIYLHPVLKEVLEETYGVMVYQEQVMRILNRLGGIELSQAYATHQGDLEEEGRLHRPEPRPVHRRERMRRGSTAKNPPRSST